MIRAHIPVSRPSADGVESFAVQCRVGRLVRLTLLATVGVTAGACGGGSSSGPTPPPNPPNPPNPLVASVTVVPRGLTLSVGGRGSLTAEVKDATGAPVAGVSVSWQSRSAAIASVDNAGGVTGVSVGQATVVAAAGGKSDSVVVTVLDDLTLEVAPAVGSVRVGGTLPFTVIARNGSGQVVAAPPVTWSTSNVAIATISAAGVATGVSRGTTAIVASARGVASAPAALTVTDAQGACGNIASVSTFVGSMDYVYGVRGTSDGGWDINGEYRGTLTATIVRVTPSAPPYEIWTGPLGGTASIHETQSAEGSGTSKLDAEGGMVRLPTGDVPTMSLIVDLRNCTYKLTAIVGLSITHTDEGGKKITSNTLASMVQVGNKASLGDWLSFGSISDVSGNAYDGHSTVWAALNLDKDAFVPLGLAAKLADGGIDEKPFGAATVSYVLRPR